MKSKFKKAILVLPVNDLKVTKNWYENTLGFKTTYLHNDPKEDPEGNYAILEKDDAEVHLILDESPREHPWTTAGTGYMFLIVDDVEDTYKSVAETGTPITRGIQKESWGARAFKLTDPSGNLILVAE